MKDSDKHKQELQDKASKEAGALRETAQEEGRKLADTVGEMGQARAQQTFETGKAQAESQLSAVQSAVDDAASRLDEEGHPFASYASELSGQLSSLSDRIEHASMDELVSDGRRVARDNPGLFMLGAVAVGFAAARFLKASEQRSDSDYIDGPDGNAFDDDVDDYAFSRATGTPYRNARPYRRVSRTPLTPVPRETIEPRVNRPVNDLDATPASSNTNTSS